MTHTAISRNAVWIPGPIWWRQAFDLIVNIPKNHTKRELTNGYKIRRGAIDHNIPLITNARLASAFIEAFCEMNLEGIQIKSWQEYK